MINSLPHRRRDVVYIAQPDDFDYAAAAKEFAHYCHRKDGNTKLPIIAILAHHNEDRLDQWRYFRIEPYTSFSAIQVEV